MPLATASTNPGGFDAAAQAAAANSTPATTDATAVTTTSSGLPTWAKWLIGLAIVGGLGAIAWALFMPGGVKLPTRARESSKRRKKAVAAEKRKPRKRPAKAKKKKPRKR